MAVTKLMLLSQRRHSYWFVFFIKVEEQKTSPLKHHFSAMKHKNDHILTCIVHEKLSQQCLQLLSFSRENCYRQSSRSFAASLCYHALLLSTTALERVGCTLKLRCRARMEQREIPSWTPTSVWALVSPAVLLLTHSDSSHRKPTQFLNPSP